MFLLSSKMYKSALSCCYTYYKSHLQEEEENIWKILTFQDSFADLGK